MQRLGTNRQRLETKGHFVARRFAFRFETILNVLRRLRRLEMNRKRLGTNRKSVWGRIAFRLETIRKRLETFVGVWRRRKAVGRRGIASETVCVSSGDGKITDYG